MIMRIYISGKIGEEVISDATRQKFARAEEMLRAKFGEDATVINPASEEFSRYLDIHFRSLGFRPEYKDILLYDLNWLCTCDSIYMLADWTKSGGANVELDFARASGKKILWENEEDAKIFTDEAGNHTDIWLPIEG